MNFSKSSERGMSKDFYNRVIGILFGQWKCNKVVSSLPSVGDGVTTRQCGKNKVEFPCPNALIEYNKYMGNVDLVDFNKKWWRICSKRKIQEMV